jgi:hypothetical protein
VRSLLDFHSKVGLLLKHKLHEDGANFSSSSSFYFNFAKIQSTCQTSAVEIEKSLILNLMYDI